MAELERRVYKKGEVIFRKGDYEPCMYRIVQGKVSVIIHLGQEDEREWMQFGADQEKRLATLDTEKFFGEMDIIIPINWEQRKGAIARYAESYKSLIVNQLQG